MQYDVKEMERMLYSLAWKYAGAGADVEDLVAEGRLAELRARRAYSESGGAQLRTLVYKYARNAMIDYVRKTNKTVTIDSDAHLASADPGHKMIDMMHSLSDEAKRVVSVIIESPSEFIDMGSSREGCGIGWSQFCRVFAESTGMTWSALRRVYAEVRDVLGE